MTASGILDNGPGVRKEKNKLWDSNFIPECFFSNQVCPEGGPYLPKLQGLGG